MNSFFEEIGTFVLKEVDIKDLKEDTYYVIDMNGLQTLAQACFIRKYRFVDYEFDK